jgi:hypothetical protein
MSKQPEALRLADNLNDYETEWCSGWAPYGQTIAFYRTAEGSCDLDGAAAELRRQHAVNTELLEALQALLESERSNSSEIVGRDVDGHPLNAAGVARVQARSAIAKATGEKYCA